MKQFFTALVVIFLILTNYSDGYKILGLFPHPGVSHFHFIQPIMRGLAEAGHEVTVVSHFPDKSPPAHYKDLPLTGRETLTNSVDLKMFENRKFYNHFVEFFMLYEWGKEACEHTLKSSALATVLKQKHKYDVIIVEQFNTDCMMGIAHVLKAPVIGLSSCAMMPWHHERVGNPIITSYMPALFLGQSEDMTFKHRLANWISMHGLRFLYKYYADSSATEQVRRKFGHQIPEIGELAKDTSMYFSNTHFSLNGAKPNSPSVIELSGIHIQKAKPLDVEIQRFLDSADHGVIYISWGSMIRSETLPVEKRDGILRALRRLKQKVIWKWENGTLPNQPENILTSKWLPQREILCHPNVKVFMSHGGLMGTTEAVYCGVPVVATPMYGDQFLNSAALQYREMGTVLNYEDITETSVLRSLKKVLEPRYMENAKTISYSYKNRPQKALDTAIWWVEYVAKTGGAPLTKSVSTYLPGYVYHSLDIYLFLLGVIVLSVSSWVWIFKKFCCRKKNEKLKQK